jgi:phosphoribosyl 1,2-cyclic phosphate phosphodiesterase
MNLTFTILGCGSSGGVPRIGGDWGACDPNNPKNRRRRCSLLVQRTSEEGTTTALIDTSPDLREQLLGTGIGWVDGVLFTHEHADHIHGIDDLRVVAINGRQRISVWSDERTYQRLHGSFGYCFKQPEGSAYPPICDHRLMSPLEPVVVSGPGGDIEFIPFDQAHGDIQSLGFRVGGLAYSSDLNDLPRASQDALAGLDVWIVDALRYSFHPTHFSVDDALAWIDRVRPRTAILTNMHIDLDYDTLRASLPDNIEPAYDGMVIKQAI